MGFDEQIWRRSKTDLRFSGLGRGAVLFEVRFDRTAGEVHGGEADREEASEVPYREGV